MKAREQALCLIGTFDEPRIIIILKLTLRKHAYSNILKILPPKKLYFSDKKNSDIFHNSAQNIDCGYSWVLAAVCVSECEYM